MAKNKLGIEINTDDIDTSPAKPKRPTLDGKIDSNRKDMMGRNNLPTGKSNISAISGISALKYGVGAQPGIDPRDMWKDPNSLRQMTTDA